MPTSESAVRAARNESIFRELNEHLAAATGDGSAVTGFVCECANISCTAVLAVPFPDYQLVRRRSDRFIVAPEDSHVDPSIERVVERQSQYWVVEKIGVAGQVAEELDDPG